MASGMAELSKLIEGGKTHRDAVAQLFKESRHVIFTGNGYSPEWPVEAQKRGLPNLHTTPLAIATFNTPKAKALFSEMGVLSAEECDARAEVMFENYNTALTTEANTLVEMIETGIIPACAQDIAIYSDMPALAGDRKKVYGTIKESTDKLKDLMGKVPHDLRAEASYLCDTIKPQMEEIRSWVDKAEGLMQRGLYPFPSYETLIYTHHS